MAEKAKHAFGALERVDESIASGVLDSFDVLFVKDANGKPYVGWVDKNGEKVICDNKTDLSGVEADISALETELATKVNADEVADQIDKAKAYMDGKVEAAINEHMVKKYEITSVPSGTLVDYRDKEIRVMCPADTKWVKQNVGSTGNANMYYMAFKAFAPEGAVAFKEGDHGVIIDEMFDFTGDFAGTDEHGRNYSICWLALASYDDTTDAWTYFGKNSSAEKYIGWDYVVEWYDADGIVIASDCIRINLSNESCHSSIVPYYIGNMKKEIDTIVAEKVAEKITEIESSYEIVEF